MNKVYVDDIISIVHFIIKKDPYNVRHNSSNWQFKKHTGNTIERNEQLKVQHIWRVESNSDADTIIAGTGITDKTHVETNLNKVLYLILELSL
jgi:hypothetical protein